GGPVVCLGVGGMHGLSGPGHALRRAGGFGGGRARLADIAQLSGSLQEAEQPHEVAGILGAAEARQRGVDHVAALGGEAVGVVLDAQAVPAPAMALQHVAQVLSGSGALAVAPDADVLDHGGETGLAQVGGAGAEGELAVGAQVHPLEHAVAARVVAGEVVHALLAEDHEPIEPALGHRPTGPAAPRGQLVLREVQCHGASDQVGVTSPRPRSSALAPSTTVVTPMRNELTAAMVGSTSSTRLFQTRTVSVCTSTPERKSGMRSSSNEVRNAKRAAENRPGRIRGSVMRRSAVSRL